MPKKQTHPEIIKANLDFAKVALVVFFTAILTFTISQLNYDVDDPIFGALSKVKWFLTLCFLGAGIVYIWQYKRLLDAYKTKRRK